jgi:hypothetical protein
LGSASDEYTRRLRSDPKIGELVTRGAMWQEGIARMTNIAGLLEGIILDAEKAAGDRAGQSQDPA